MGAQPKRKISTRRKGKRRQHHTIVTSTLVKCSNCDKNKIRHHLCQHCHT